MNLNMNYEYITTNLSSVSGYTNQESYSDTHIGCCMFLHTAIRIKNMFKFLNDNKL